MTDRLEGGAPEPVAPRPFAPTPVAQRVARRAPIVAVVLLCATPTLMIVAREIPATMLVAVTAALVAGAIAAGLAGAALGDLRRAGATIGGAAALGLVALAAASVSWSPTPARGAAHVVHFGGGLLLAAVAVAMTLRTGLRLPARALALALGAAALLAALDLASGSALREAAAFDGEAYRLNRVAVAIALFLPLATALLAAERRHLLLGALWAIGLAAIGLSISHSAKLGLLVAILVLVPALLAPLLVHRIVAIASVVVFLAMPFLAPIANDLVPARVHEAVGYGSLTIRGEIWAETAPFVRQKPVLGWGIEASHALPGLPEAAGLAPAQRDLLSWGHPHNAPLQIWLELGLVGALLAAIALAAGFAALARLPRPLLPAATATAASAFAIACVSHGAFQAWWWGLLGLLAIAYAAAARDLSAREP